MIKSFKIGQQMSSVQFRTACDMCVLALVTWLAGDALLRTGVSSVLWLLVYGYVGLMALLNLSSFLANFARNQNLLLIGYLAMISTVWSILPSWSFIAGIQLTMTIIIGIYFGSRFDLREILLITAIATGATIFVSMFNLTGMFGRNYSDVGGFLGIYTHKNLFAQQIGLFILCAMPFFYDTVRLRGIIAMTIMMAFYFLWISKSVATLGGILIFCSGLAAIYLLMASAKMRFLSTGFVMTCVVAAFLISINLEIGFWDVLATFEKDSTLTGRLDIWKVGIQHFKQDEWIGIGYAAYWRSPEFISEINILKSYFGENVTAFHNFAIEALVSFGILAILPLAAFCCTPIFLLFRLANSVDRETPLCFVIGAIAIIGFGLFLALFGPLLMRQHETTMFIFPALAVAAQCELIKQMRYA